MRRFPTTINFAEIRSLFVLKNLLYCLRDLYDALFHAFLDTMWTFLVTIWRLYRAEKMSTLTKRVVEQFPLRNNRDYIEWDSELPEFGVRMWPSGRTVYF
jgi:hypothetical protein